MIRVILLLLLSIGAAHADTVRTSDGSSCSFDSDDSAYEVSLYARSNNRDTRQNNFQNFHNNYNDNGEQIGIEFTYKFGGPKRLNCDSLYQIELRTKTAQLRLLEQKIKTLEKAQLIKWNK